MGPAPRLRKIRAQGHGICWGSYRETYEATTNGTKIVRAGKGELRPELKLLWWIYGTLLRRRQEARNQQTKRLPEAGHGERRGSIDAR